tara:strand:- start:1443 stop:1682 length:240 start_codon:yes stop_codon:yes gene_type:complete
MFGPMIFTKNLGMGLRVFINMKSSPGLFLLVFIPFAAWDLLMITLDLAWVCIKLVYGLIKFIVTFIPNVKAEAKKTGEL